MKDIRQYGVGTGGIGRSAFDVVIRGLFETEATLRSFTLENANSPLAVDELIISSASTTVAVPTNAGSLWLVPSAYNTVGATIKTDVGDTGITMHPVVPVFLPFPATPPANIYLDWAGSVYEAEAVTVDSGTDKITLAGHTLQDGDRVQFSGTSVPSGLVAGEWYYVVNAATNDFQVSTTEGGTAIDILSAGTAVTITSSQSFVLFWL